MNAIEQYLQDCGAPKKIVENTIEKAKRNPDIYDEFIKTAERGNFDECELVVEGYTAKDISELADFMNVIGVYNFLCTLRENPEYAKDQIEKGFPRK